MSNRLHNVLTIVNAIGFVLLTISSFIRNDISDFSLGFIEGLAVTFIVVGFINIVVCMVKRRNPFKIG